MENKIQKLVKDLSKNERIQTVMHDVHKLQMKLNDEMSKTLTMFKKSAGDIEKNIQTYKKQLVGQKDRLEKELRAKAKAMQGKPVRRASSKKATSAKAATTTTTKKKTRRGKKTSRKASSKKTA
jgi:hypothetical protein